MKFIGIIPARYASTRFPGKPLVDIKGKTMIQRTYERASQALDVVYVATDDERIRQAVIGFGGNVAMTSAEHKTGTDRLLEAIAVIEKKRNEKFDVVLNIQGDEPFINAKQLHLLTGSFTPKTQIATLVKPISDNAEIFDENRPKVVFTKTKKALYFSRSPIPFVRGSDKKNWIDKYSFHRHLGMYAYRRDILEEIYKLEQSPIELAESLEQNRWLENGFEIHVEITLHESPAVDTPADLQKILDSDLIFD